MSQNNYSMVRRVTFRETLLNVSLVTMCWLYSGAVCDALYRGFVCDALYRGFVCDALYSGIVIEWHLTFLSFYDAVH